MWHVWETEESDTEDWSGFVEGHVAGTCEYGNETLD